MERSIRLQDYKHANHKFQTNEDKRRAFFKKRTDNYHFEMDQKREGLAKKMKLTDSYVKKYEDYQIKKIREKEIKLNQKPIFKYYHIDNTIKFNFNEDKNNDLTNYSKLVPKSYLERFQNVKSKIDSGLGNLRKVKHHISHNNDEIQREVEQPVDDKLFKGNCADKKVETTTPKRGFGLKRNKELLQILRDSIHKKNYNLRTTPRRSNIISNKNKSAFARKSIQTGSTYSKNKRLSSTKKARLSKSLAFKEENLLPIEERVMLDHMYKETPKPGAFDYDLTEYPTEEAPKFQVNWLNSLFQRNLNQLNALNEEWETYLADHKATLSENIVDEIQTQMRRMNLFKIGRFKQYGELIIESQNMYKKYEIQGGDIKTNKTVLPKIYPSDLIGFWEMISPQVKDIEKIFASLNVRRQNNWIAADMPETPISTKRQNIRRSKVHKHPKTPKRTSSHKKVSSNVKKSARINVSGQKEAGVANIPCLKQSPGKRGDNKAVKKHINFAEWKKTKLQKGQDNINQNNNYNKFTNYDIQPIFMLNDVHIKTAEDSALKNKENETPGHPEIELLRESALTSKDNLTTNQIPPNVSSDMELINDDQTEPLNISTNKFDIPLRRSPRHITFLTPTLDKSTSSKYRKSPYPGSVKSRSSALQDLNLNTPTPSTPNILTTPFDSSIRRLTRSATRRFRIAQQQNISTPTYSLDDQLNLSAISMYDKDKRNDYYIGSQKDENKENITEISFFTNLNTFDKSSNSVCSPVNESENIITNSNNENNNDNSVLKGTPIKKSRRGRSVTKAMGEIRISTPKNQHFSPYGTDTTESHSHLAIGKGSTKYHQRRSLLNSPIFEEEVTCSSYNPYPYFPSSTFKNLNNLHEEPNPPKILQAQPLLQQVASKTSRRSTRISFRNISNLAPIIESPSH